MSDQLAATNLSVLNNPDQSNLVRLPQDIFKKASAYFDKKEVKKINLAYCVALEAHEGQLRRDGSPYISHPVEVASILLDLKVDLESVCAGFMHDVLEDCDVQKTTLEKMFGKDVVSIIDGVSKLNKMDFKNIAERNAGSFQKMALAMSKDIRVILVKLCDRLHNMRTIDFLPRDKQIQKCIETLDVYGPIAIRIGMQNLREELEDRAFKCLHPMRARLLKSAIKNAKRGRERIVYKLKKEIKKNLKDNGVQATVKGRQKSLFSLYRKIKYRKRPFNEILDVFAFRIIVNSVDDAYRSLGIVHNFYKPIENRFKDYVAIPKSNGYQALHTTLIALEGIPIEVQIQTKNMVEIAENGVAAHWAYKTEKSDASEGLGARKWLKSIIDYDKEAENSNEFFETIKSDLFNNEVYVFTPDGDILNLKNGATPIDFAYELHTDIGNNTVGCKVHRKYAPLNIQLESGQSIEIEVSEDAEPSPAWLNFVTTSKARSAIRSSLRQQKISQARKAGKVMLESELARSGLSLEDYRGSRLQGVLKLLGVDSLNNLLTDLGLGRKTGAIVAEKFFEEVQAKGSKNKVSGSLILEDHNIEGVTVVYAKCCMPVYGDPIKAHTDTDRGIVIHHSRCRQLSKNRDDASRFFSAIWGDNRQERYYRAHIKIVGEDRPGSLADLASVFAKMNINISNARTRDLDTKFTEFMFEGDVLNLQHLQALMKKIRSKKFVNSCVRIINDAKSKNEKTNY